ncbi:uncharacterized protein LOC112566804 [Pomacea canaliculata]|uniref:uncharacterized protein LOC112566804 n=1 Tax=Pomacea canaliculata TaxID=400727 RepID=UPI000D729106|nr:uncharacterized protein LOC112566804 [Pomacea canaliculata]XP_025098954.1 uncharacterized protein LOC112566804 [Pomacea canaliculata]XP_025098955.1 uncharacterized protein LOC112566804 [Pomacea canaliculata]XP_025098956.1 uncharacterized protein LOC112566804 [Pomacea canaliculata]
MVTVKQVNKCVEKMSRCKELTVWPLLLLVLSGIGYHSVTPEFVAPGVSYEMPDGPSPTMAASVQPKYSISLEASKTVCCRGTLGYASGDYLLPYPCASSRCCNDSETVAVIPVDIALGFKFVCMPRTGVRTLCYQAGSEVCTSNQDPDHVPRTCCSGARFSVLLNRWYAAMIIRCVEGVHDSR